MYLFFYMALELNGFNGANPLHGPLEGVGPENIDFFGVQVALASLLAISRPQKVSIFTALVFQWNSKWICPLKIITSHAL